MDESRVRVSSSFCHISWFDYYLLIISGNIVVDSELLSVELLQSAKILNELAALNNGLIDGVSGGLGIWYNVFSIYVLCFLDRPFYWSIVLNQPQH